ncbi:helix-turn-helix transcriptional regulator [Staphylococcus felis]|uniref:helix-turn-helix transcriptional regulator n=1 Tax=Staphylococcus felis TaxID=46127 RepID=UPI003966C1ED
MNQNIKPKGIYTLRMLRAREELTQAEAGKKVGVSADVWHNWENEKSFPNLMQLKKIEKEFKTSYDEIIFFTDK